MRQFLVVDVWNDDAEPFVIDAVDKWDALAYCEIHNYALLKEL